MNTLTTNKTITTYHSGLATIIMSFLAILLASCNSDRTSNAKPIESKISNTIILLYDISLSNDEYAILRENHLRELFSRIAFNGGGKFYALLIKTNSRNQEIFEYDIPTLDTLGLQGNVYQIEKRKKANQAKKDLLEVSLEDFVTAAKSKLLLPKSETFTDLEQALSLAKTTASQPNVLSTNVNILIISDGINDLPPRHGEDKMEPVEFDNAQVILIRPDKTDFVKGQKVIVNSIQDAITNLK